LKNLVFSASFNELKLMTKSKSDIVSMALTIAEKVEENVNKKLTYTYYRIREPIVFLACTSFLKDKKLSSEFLQKIFQTFEEHLYAYGFSDSGHGKLFEKCIAASLIQMTKGKNLTFSQLPFIKILVEEYKVTLPSWMNSVICEFKDFGLPIGDETKSISNMIKNNSKYLMMPSNFLGQDLFNCLSTFNKSIYTISLSSKLFHNGVPWNEHIKSYKTTDINYCYSQQQKHKGFKKIYNQDKKKKEKKR